MRLSAFPALLLAVCLATACTKDRDKGFIAATVRDSGDISDGGCGYLLDVDGVGEKRPDYLPSAYQQNGTKVLVKFHETGILDTCGNKIPYTTHLLIGIDDIKRDR